MKKKTKWEIEYYEKVNGDIPVVAFLKSLSPKMRAKAYNEIELLKKTNRTPKGELEKAIKYRNDYEKRCNDE